MNIAKEQAPLLPGRVPGFKRTDLRLPPCIFKSGFIFSLVCLLIASLNKKENPNLREQYMTLASTFTFLKFKVMMASHQSSSPLLMVRLPLRVWNKWHFNKNLQKCFKLDNYLTNHFLFGIIFAVSFIVFLQHTFLSVLWLTMFYLPLWFPRYYTLKQERN